MGVFSKLQIIYKYNTLARARTIDPSEVSRCAEKSKNTRMEGSFCACLSLCRIGTFVDKYNSLPQVLCTNQIRGMTPFIHAVSQPIYTPLIPHVFITLFITDSDHCKQINIEYWKSRPKLFLGEI